MKRWLTNSFFPLLLAAVGTFALVYSWTYEKKELADATEDMARLQRSQLVIDIDEVARDQWIIAFNQEVGKVNPNPDVLAVTANGAVTNLVMWQSHMEMRVAKSAEQYQLAIAGRETIIAQARQYADKKDYKALSKMLQDFERTSRESDSTSHLDTKFFSEVDEANARVSAAESGMRLWYILGTAALLLSSIVSNVLLERSSQRLERQILSKRSR